MLRFLIVFAVASTALTALGQVNWTWRNPLPQGNTLNAVFHTNGTFIAVGNAGAVLTSADGLSWTSQKASTGNSLFAVAQGNGFVVAVGENGAVIRSPDAVSWSLGSSGTNATLRGVSFANGLFVAVGGSSSEGVILTSPDGITWTTRVSGVSRSFYAVVYGNGRFVAVGENNLFYTSTDGVSWISTAASANENYLRTVVFGNGMFVAGGAFGVILTSSDGLNWTPRTTNINETINVISYGNGMFTAGVTDGAVLFSPDGVNWSRQSIAYGSALLGATTRTSPGLFVFVGTNGAILSTPDSTTWKIRGGIPGSIARGNGVYVGAAGSYTATSTNLSEWSFHRQSIQVLDVTFGSGLFAAISTTAIYTSTDGINWTSRVTGLSYPFNFNRNIRYSNGRFIAAADGKIATSVNGTSWTVATVGSLLRSGAFGNGVYVAVGGASNTNEIYTSTTGTTWTKRISSAISGFTDVTFGNGLFIAVGNEGNIFTSPDGVTWTNRTSGTTTYLASVTWGNDMFVVSSSAGLLLTSTDGITWTDRSLPTSTELNVVFDGVEFISGGGRIVTSLDGIAWTFRTPPPVEAFQDVIYGNGQFVAVTQWSNYTVGSTILTSSDGITWTTQATFKFWLNGVGYANGLYFAGGEKGKLLTSTDGVHWTERITNSTRTIRRFAYGNGLFVAVGGSYSAAELLTSPDGVVWTVRSPAAANNELNDITFAEGIFVAVGGQNGRQTLITSPDGIEWTSRNLLNGTPQTEALLSIAYGNDTFVTVGAAGIIASSSNGIDWVTQVPESSYYSYEVNDVIYAGGNFVAVRRYDGKVLTSPDGANWLLQNPLNAAGVSALTFGGDKFVSVGVGSAILTSIVEQPPSAPLGLSVIPTSSRGTKLVWQDTSGEAGYRIERRIEPNGSWYEVASSLPSNFSTFDDSGLNPGVAYGYRIRAVFGAGTSLYSDVATVRTFTPSEQWRSDRFSTNEDSGLAADSADPDGDGTENLLERAFGLDPMQPAQGGLPAATYFSTWNLRFVFTRDAANTDLVYELEASEDLQNWTTIVRSSGGKTSQHIGLGASSLYEEAIGGTRFRVTAIVNSSKNRRFLRIRVSRP